MAESSVAGFGSDSTADSMAPNLPSRNPRLPLELEREVFEMAASSLGNIFNLILVASRVKEWIEPLLYRVVVRVYNRNDGLPRFTPFETLVHKIGSKPPVFWSKSVKSLAFYGIEEQDPVEQILTACTGLVRLCTASPRSRFLPALKNFPALRHLCIEIEALFGGLSFVDFAHPAFHNITHLELLDVPRASADERAHQICTGLVHIPKLTHIALNAEVMYRALFPLLYLLTHLRAIVLLGRIRADLGFDLPTHLTMEGRFVSIRQTDWKRDWLSGADTGEDFWALADKFLAARRAGKVDRSRFNIYDDEDEWLAVAGGFRICDTASGQPTIDFTSIIRAASIIQPSFSSFKGVTYPRHMWEKASTP
ncbi:hypothetical protein B0H16DRAFT_1698730 [Mycena metata]|uniref:Uncharacterized protein n=1 Tax=Mycena metata TaxID=1033252 RepID=A0AAD7HP79_9AGAR|nr:hypothetical protein B0H16DRAFT_1698730 [Mycena metata]